MAVSHLQVKVRPTPGGAVLDLRGEINSFAQEALNAAYAEAEAKDPVTILLEVEEVDYINSTSSSETSSRAVTIRRPTCAWPGVDRQRRHLHQGPGRTFPARWAGSTVSTSPTGRGSRSSVASRLLETASWSEPSA
jgi:hypothetical protein